jgi:hypothetical protein
MVKGLRVHTHVNFIPYFEVQKSKCIMCSNKTFYRLLVRFTK